MRSQMAMFFPALAIALSLCISNVDAATSLPQPVKLEWHYYKVHNICDDAEVYIRHQVELMMKTDKSISGKLLRLAYSDCFVSGCDASVLLDGPDSEKTAPQNRGLGGFVVIDKIKTVLESRCEGKVSCADILQLATRDAVHWAGGPSYPVFTGRKDGTTSKASSVDLPSPSISWQNALKYFKSRGLDALDMVTLLGAHSIGKTHCSQVEDRLYNNNNKLGPSMNASFLAEMRKLCPPRERKGQSDPLVFLNPESGSSYKLTKSYYSRILTHEAVLGVDQQLLLGEDTRKITEEFAADFEDFRKSLALSMSRMGSISVLTGEQGEIRANCRVTNANLHKY